MLTQAHHISVPHYPEEDSKLRATRLQVRRGGNCPNTLEVLAQLFPGTTAAAVGSEEAVHLYLVSSLPSADSQATSRIRESFGAGSANKVNLSHCLFRSGVQEPASSYIIRSGATGSRTLVNYNELPEMTLEEFAEVADGFRDLGETWWHFEVWPWMTYV